MFCCGCHCKFRQCCFCICLWFTAYIRHFHWLTSLADINRHFCSFFYCASGFWILTDNLARGNIITEFELTTDRQILVFQCSHRCIGGLSCHIRYIHFLGIFLFWAGRYRNFDRRSGLYCLALRHILSNDLTFFISIRNFRSGFRHFQSQFF